MVLGFKLLVGFDNSLDEGVPDYILLGQVAEGNALDLVQNFFGDS